MGTFVSFYRLLANFEGLAIVTSAQNPVSLYCPHILPPEEKFPLQAKSADSTFPCSLLSRIQANINQTYQTLVTARHIQLAEILNTVGIILSIIGGVNSGNDYGTTGRYEPQTLSKVGLALFIASFVAILAFTVLLSLSISHAEAGEKRILLAVAASLPLLLVRLIYSSVYTFGNYHPFSSLTGSVTLLLCMALLEEMAIVAIFEGVGLTLRKSNGHRGGAIGKLSEDGRETRFIDC